MDVNLSRAASLAERFKLSSYSNKPEEIINDDKINLVYIASNHFTHAEYAIEALKRNKSVHIEKPHVVNRDQLNRLTETIKESKGKVRLGFNRPASRFGKLILDHLKKESGTTMINWFVAGHKIDPSHWYFHDKEGGRVLGNLCHWTDFIYQMINEKDRFPIRIIPTRSEKADCDISVSYVFGDGSIASINFSEKGHTFEGVREKLNVHKGNTLITMDDFEKMRVDVLDKKIVYKNFFRDHGHQHNIMRSYEMISKDKDGESLKYIYESADLFLKTKEALEEKKEIVVEEFKNS
jgi:predicted dehydrogenase